METELLRMERERRVQGNREKFKIDYVHIQILHDECDHYMWQKNILIKTKTTKKRSGVGGREGCHPY